MKSNPFQMSKNRVFYVLIISGICLLFFVCIVMCTSPKNINEDLNSVSKENKLYAKNINGIENNAITYYYNSRQVSHVSKITHTNSLGSNQGNSSNFEKKMHSNGNAFSKPEKAPSLNIPNSLLKAKSSEIEKIMPQSVILEARTNNENSFNNIIDQKNFEIGSDENSYTKISSNQNDKTHLSRGVIILNNCDESNNTSADIRTENTINNTNENKTENIKKGFQLIDQKILEKIAKKHKNKKKQIEIFYGTNIDLKKRDDLAKAGFNQSLNSKKRKFIDEFKTNARFVAEVISSAKKGIKKDYNVPSIVFVSNSLNISDWKDVIKNDLYNKDDCAISFYCKCTKKFEYYESQLLLFTELYDHYRKINNPDKKFIIIHVVQGYYTEITVELCNREHPEYLKTTLSNVLEVKECKYHNQFSLHLNHIVNNVTNYFKYASEIQKSCNRKILVYVHESKTNDFCKKFDINVKYSCIYIGNDTDVYMNFLVEHFADTKQILDYGKGKKYRYKHLLDENIV